MPTDADTLALVKKIAAAKAAFRSASDEAADAQMRMFEAERVVKRLEIVWDRVVNRTSYGADRFTEAQFDDELRAALTPEPRP